MTRATGNTTTSSSSNSAATNGRVAFPSPAELRGIPAAGRGVNGAVPGTTPGDGLDDWPIPDED